MLDVRQIDRQRVFLLLILFSSGTADTKVDVQAQGKEVTDAKGVQKIEIDKLVTKIRVENGNIELKAPPNHSAAGKFNRIFFLWLRINLDQNTMYHDSSSSRLIFSFEKQFHMFVKGFRLPNYFAQLAFSSLFSPLNFFLFSRGRSNVLQLESTISPGHSQPDYRGHSSDCEQSIGRESVERSHETRIASLVR